MSTRFMTSSGLFCGETSKLFSFIEMEKEEIARIKWVESEREGKDVGDDRAMFVWITRHRDGWRRGLRASGLY